MECELLVWRYLKGIIFPAWTHIDMTGSPNILFFRSNLELFLEVTSSEDLLESPTKLWKVIYMDGLQARELVFKIILV